MTATPATFEGIRTRDLIRKLEGDPRVRTWLAGGVLLSAAEAAAFVGVDRPRLWRWERNPSGNRQIAPLMRTGATPLYFRPDLERLRSAVEADPHARRRPAEQTWPDKHKRPAAKRERAKAPA